MMREVSYKDSEGRYHQVQLPEGVPDSDASLGIPIGPPSLASLGLPPEVEIRLHNQLFARRIFCAGDARARRRDVFGALQAALKIDVAKVVEVFLIGENGHNRSSEVSSSDEVEEAD